MASLDEEIKKEMVKLPFFIRGKDQIAFARHFAEWQKSQMLKDAVEGSITSANGALGYDIAAFRFDDNHKYTILLPHKEGRKYGDKVRIIIVKED